MSMLSAQIDRLRHEADILRDHGTFIGYGGLTSTDPEMIECADLMSDAADTIWQLRDDLQRTNAVLMDVEHDESVAWDRVRKAEAENRRLRESCSELLRMAESNDPDFLHWPEIHDELRKLGVKIVKL